MKETQYLVITKQVVEIFEFKVVSLPAGATNDEVRAAAAQVEVCQQETLSTGHRVQVNIIEAGQLSAKQLVQYQRKQGWKTQLQKLFRRE